MEIKPMEKILYPISEEFFNEKINPLIVIPN
jgi:hypothetical protein